MDNEDIKFLLIRYLGNQATEQEIAEVNHWISLHPENELYFIELYEAWQNSLLLNTDAINDEKAYGLFQKKIRIEDNEPVKRFKWANAAIGALVLLAAVSAFLFLSRRPLPLEDKYRIVSENGSVKKLTLSDGTVIWLNAGSTITYNAGFGKSNRIVYLEGEAFFDIGHHNSNLPFIVYTKNYTIRDIGTRFNLKAYTSDPFFETSVVKGEISVEENSTTKSENTNRIYVKSKQVLKIYFKPQQEEHKQPVQVPDSYKEVRILQVDSARMNIYDGWKDDLLIFEGVTLGELSKTLERRYNVRITIANEDLQDIRYSGSFKNVPDIARVLYLIKQNTPINYKIEGQNITINKTN